MQTLLLLSLVFAPLAFASVEPWALATLQITAFAAAARIYIRGRAVYPNPLYKNLIPAVLGIALLGLLQAFNETPVTAAPAVLFTAWRPATLNAVLVWLFYAAVMFAVPQIINTPQRFTRLMWTVFAMGVLIALIGMFQKTGDNTVVYGLRTVRGQAFGPFINRDHGAYFLAMAAMAGLGLFFSGWRALAAQQSRTRLFDLLAVQLLKLVMVGTLIYGIYQTGSRGGLHSFAFAAAVTGFIAAGFVRTRKFRLAGFFGMALLLTGYGVFVYQNKKLLGLADGAFDRSVTIRFSMYQSGRAMLKDFPLLGSGLGAVEYAFPPYKRPDVPMQGLVRHVHSDWLELFLQVGFAGGLIYNAGLALALFTFFKTWRNCLSFSLKAMYGGALGAVLAALTHNFVEFGSQMPANALFFYTLVGALASAPPAWARRRPEDEDAPEPVPVKKSRALAAAALAALLCLCTLPNVIAWVYDQRAADAPYAEKVRRHAASLRWRPNPQYAFRLALAHYNQAFKDPSAAPALLRTAQESLAPWLTRAPVNYDLNSLQKTIRYFQAHPPKAR